MKRKQWIHCIKIVNNQFGSVDPNMLHFDLFSELVVQWSTGTAADDIWSMLEDEVNAKHWNLKSKIAVVFGGIIKWNELLLEINVERLRAYCSSSVLDLGDDLADLGGMLTALLIY